MVAKQRIETLGFIEVQGKATYVPDYEYPGLDTHRCRLTHCPLGVGGEKSTLFAWVEAGKAIPERVKRYRLVLEEI